MRYRVVYVEVQRRHRPSGIGRWVGAREPLRETRQRLAEEMERIGEEMLRRGLRLVTVTPMVRQEPPSIVTSEAVWMHFAADPAPIYRDDPSVQPGGAFNSTKPA